MTSPEFKELLAELFAPMGLVTMRAMFGGLGIYHQNLMFALVADDVLYFKADAETIPHFQVEGCPPFRYEKKDGSVSVMSYWQAPERLYEEAEEFLVFARRAFRAAAQNIKKKKSPQKTKHSLSKIK